MKRIVTLFLAFAMVIAVIPQSPAAYGAEPWGIPVSTKEDLDNIRNDLEGDYYLTNDIVFTEEDFEEGGAFYNDGQGWEPVGSSYETSFSGTFDGQGFSIEGLRIYNRDTAIASAGLFGYADGHISNLVLEGVSITSHSEGGLNEFHIWQSDSYAGGVAGYLKPGGSISNVSVSGDISASSDSVSHINNNNAGGVAGFSEEGRITDCRSEAEVRAVPVEDSTESMASAGGIAGCAVRTVISGCGNGGSIVSFREDPYWYAGGISGQSHESQISECYNSGEIKAYEAGGITGLMATGSIDNCYNAGMIMSNSDDSNGILGGIAGEVNSAQSSIEKCYNSGEVQKTEYGYGAIVSGLHDGAHLDSCYFYMADEISGAGNMQTEETVPGITGLTELEMRSAGSFAGFDFENIWSIDSSAVYQMPYLSYQTAMPSVPIQTCFVERIGDIEYTGMEISPDIKVVNGSEVLTEGEDYDIAYSDNKDIGTGIVTITGKGIYKGTKTVKFNIVPADISSRKVTLSYYSVIYDQNTYHEPDVTVEGLTEGEDYRVTYRNNFEAGTASVEINGIGNYRGTRTVTFEIMPADISNVRNMHIWLQYESTEFDGTPKTPDVYISVDGFILTEGYECTYSDNINAGNATAEVKFEGDYTGAKVISFEITPADISGRNISLSYTDTEYDGTEKKPEVTVEGLISGKDYTVSYEDNKEAGDARVVITGKGNYKGTVIRTFQIIKPETAADRIFGKDIRKRIAGGNRYQTSMLVADNYIMGLETGSLDTIIVANGDVYADALAGGYLAKVKQAPILMVNKYNEDPIREYIQGNVRKGGTVYLLGGTAAVSENFGRSLAGAYDVVRLGGADRYETNLKILEEAGVKDEEILICSAMDFADSLSASSSGRPIMLVGKSLSPAQKQYIGDLDSRKFYIIGGKGAVNSNVDKEIKALSKITERIDGANRYVTSYNVAKEFFPGDHENIILASGNDFPDGLVGGPLGVMVEGPLLLINDRNTGNAADYVEDSDAYRCLALGGTSLISETAVRNIMNR